MTWKSLMRLLDGMQRIDRSCSVSGLENILKKTRCEKMALVQCTNCGEKMIEEDDVAILECPYCGNKAIEVLEDEQKREENKMELKEIIVEIKNGNDLELEEAIENQYGEEIPPATLYFYDGEWAISELNCFSSKRAGLGTCNCNSHPAFIERVITEEHAINIISEYIKNKKQG